MPNIAFCSPSTLSLPSDTPYCLQLEMAPRKLQGTTTNKQAANGAKPGSRVAKNSTSAFVSFLSFTSLFVSYRGKLHTACYYCSRNRAWSFVKQYTIKFQW